MEGNSEKTKRLAELRDEVSQLERELQETPGVWQLRDTEYYGMYHAAGGFALGIIGAVVSLLFNVVGALVVGLHPLRLIQVYLTFPLGERALSNEFDTEWRWRLAVVCILAQGCCWVFPFRYRWLGFSPMAVWVARLVFATVLGVVLWLVNFYGILSWLQPHGLWRQLDRRPERTAALGRRRNSFGFCLDDGCCFSLGPI